MQVIFGLGNPEKKYQRSRHNAGYIVLDEMAGELGLNWVLEEKFKAEIAKGKDFLLVKPLTHMNNSGECVNAISSFYKLEPSDIVIVHDDVDLEFGRIKNQLGGSAAGHHGVLDIAEKLKTFDFWRYRVGVGRPEEKKFDVMDWVLSDFSDEELSVIKKKLPAKTN